MQMGCSSHSSEAALAPPAAEQDSKAAAWQKPKPPAGGPFSTSDDIRRHRKADWHMTAQATPKTINNAQ